MNECKQCRDYSSYLDISQPTTILRNNLVKTTDFRHNHIAMVLNGPFKKIPNYTTYGINNVTITNDVSEHAEVNALKKLPPNKDHPIRINILVLRISKQGVLGMSKPCAHCLDYMSRIKGYTIRHIYYSNEEGKIIRHSYNQLANDENKHVSTGYKCKQNIKKL